MSDTLGKAGPDLRHGYEVLRAQATGQGCAGTMPQGWALFVRSGFPAWMAAWAQVAPSLVSVRPRRYGEESSLPLVDLGREVAMVLVEMALTIQGKE